MDTLGLVVAAEANAGIFQCLLHADDAGGHDPFATVLIGRHGSTTDPATFGELLLAPVEKCSSCPDLRRTGLVLLFAQDVVPNRLVLNTILTQKLVVAQNVHCGLTSDEKTFSD